MFTDDCVSECLCIVYANELQLAIQAYYYCLLFFFFFCKPKQLPALENIQSYL